MKIYKKLPTSIVFLHMMIVSLCVSCTHDYEDTPVAKIVSFCFEPAYNPELGESIFAEIIDNNIYITLPYGVSLNELTATFAYAGELVKIGETKQEPGVSTNDFSTTVIYRVIAKDGTFVDYTVTADNKTSPVPRIPRIYVDTEGGAGIYDKENYVRATVTVEDLDEIYTATETFTATAGIRGRGNTTWAEPKKPYRIKLDQKASLLGMSTDKDWALLANHLDKTLLRNIAAFEISRMAGMSWTPGSVSVDFYLNGDYQGVYTLTEHVKVADERLNMTLVTPDDNEGEAVTGGYLLELDGHFDQDPYQFKTDLMQLPIMYKDPDKPTAQQQNFVMDYFNTAESVLFSGNFADPNEGYRKYIDVESFINYYVIQELSKNVDGSINGQTVGSCYLAIRRGGKIEQPLVWDFDLAFGNADYIVSQNGASSYDWDGWYIKTCSPWFDRFFADPAFVSELKTRWNALKPQLDGLPDFIREYAENLDYAQGRNFGSKACGGAGWDITEVKWNTDRVRGSYSAEVDYLVDFVTKRLQWLDVNINAL